MKNSTRFILFIAIILGSWSTQAQDPNIIWQNNIGGNADDDANSIIQNTVGNYVIMATSRSDATGDKDEDSQGSEDYWVLELDPEGNILWQNTIGGDRADGAMKILQTPDGGYFIAGTSNSFLSGDKTEDLIGGRDYWVLKLDSTGNIQWQNTIGGDQFDFLRSAALASDGGYVLAGWSDSPIGFDKSESPRGGYDYWIVKLNSSGTVIWDRTIGGDQDDFAEDIFATSDNGFIVTGSSDSDVSGNKTQDNNGVTDYWIIKLNSSGSIQWQQSIGGSGTNAASSIVQNSDGDYLVGGFSTSGISGDKTEVSRGGFDYWVLKLDSSGDIIWDKTIGGNNDDFFRTLNTTSDGGVFIGGYTTSGLSGDKTENSVGGSFDMWGVKLASDGSFQWDETLGGTGFDFLYTSLENSEGNLILAGLSTSGVSVDHDEPNLGGSDIWILEYNNLLSVADINSSMDLSLSPIPAESSLNISLTDTNIESVSIYAIDGRELLQTKGDNQSSMSLNVELLPTGTYFIKVAAEGQVQVKRFIKL